MRNTNNLKLFTQIAFCDDVGVFSECDENWGCKTENLNLLPEFSGIALLKFFVASQKVTVPIEFPLLLPFHGLRLNCRNRNCIHNVWNRTAATEVVDGLF
jgi:hypothetical protein